MILPMERSEVFKILSDIFQQNVVMKKMLLTNTKMKESTCNPSDIDFWYEESTCNPSDIDLLFDGTPSLVGYLRIVNPPENCVDGEYCFVYHSSVSQKDGNIAIDPFGNIRVYGDDITSFIYHAIKGNANRLADYAKKLTRTYQNQVADTAVIVVKTYCETLMNEHASDFEQMDISVSKGCCTDFLIRAINEPERNFQFGVVRHIYEHNIIGNNIWVRFSKPDEWLWTPIIIKPSIGDIIINTEQCVFTAIVGAKEIVRLARLISDQTGFSISVRDWNGSSTREQNVAKYITSLFQKHEVLDTVKQVSKEKDEYIGCDEVFQVVVDWLHAISSLDRIKDVKNINHLDHTLSVSNSVGCGASKQYVTKELKVSYTPYMKSIMISLGKEHIITIDYLGLGDKSTCVYILKYNPKEIDNVLNKYLIACLAERLQKVFKLDKLRAYSTVKCTQYTELKHCGTTFFNDDGKTAYVIDPKYIIINKNINKNNTVSSIDDIVDLVKKNLAKTPESGHPMTTKEYLYSHICEKLTLWQQGVFHEIYSAIYCTLAESKYVGSAFELERHFMELVGTDKDGEGFHVYFRLNNIHEDLPKFDIAFFDKDNAYIRMQENEWTEPCALIKRGDDIKIYRATIKYMKDSYKTIVSHVVSKIVLLEGLS